MGYGGGLKTAQDQPRSWLVDSARPPRCAATHVNPGTATRDMNVLEAPQRGFGHIDMGVCAEVIGGGETVTGDRITAA